MKCPPCPQAKFIKTGGMTESRNDKEKLTKTPIGYWEINITSLKQLLKLCEIDDAGDLVILTTEEDPALPVIEIYDNYRE